MGDWTENKYTETRFGGMDAAHEPHTLDRDGGMMAYIFNMLTRTQGLATRKGYRMIEDIRLNYTPNPGTPKASTGLIPYEANLSVVPDDENGEEEPTTGGTVYPSNIIPDASGSFHSTKPPREEEDEEERPLVAGSFTISCPETVYCDIPFLLSATRTGQATGQNFNGDSTTLRVAMRRNDRHTSTTSYLVTPKPNKGWENNAWSGTMRMMVRTRIYDHARFRIQRSADDGAECIAAYVVGDMVPELPSTVGIGGQFTYTIKYKHSGSVLTGYIGEGSGMSVSFVGLDSEGNVVTPNIASRVGNGSWSNGVLTGQARVASDVGSATVLCLRVTFAGETQSDTADIVQSLSIIICPEKLHVYGDSEALMLSGN